jgi:hypothetical protein
MALIDLGITKDEGLAPGAQVPPGEYEAEYLGLLQNQEQGGVVFTSNSGNKMMKARFRVVNHADPLVNGKNLPIYNAVVGTFSFSDFMEAVPQFWARGQPDSEAGIGTVVKVKVSYGKGDYAEQTSITKLKRK